MSDWSIPSRDGARAAQPAASPSDPSDDDLIDEIVADCIESGATDLSARISHACDSHPRLASAIRRRFESLREVGLLGERVSGDERYPERLGHFRLLERLGGGGMGVVFRARQESLGRDVALKLIRPEHLYFDRARERFRRETEAVARLSHPNIVPIYEVGEENGVPYFAMELVAGATLAAAMAELGSSAPERLTGADLRRGLIAATPARARSASDDVALFAGTYADAIVALVVQVADALQHAHSRAVLHRDVKPSNVAATPDGRALLFDFGLAGFHDEAQRMTATRAEIGSLPYMAPEQLRDGSRAASPRADVYALGVTLYELLALQLPYAAGDPLETRRAILEGRRDPLRARNRAVSRDLELVCAKAMEVDASRRYASAAELAADLRNVLEHRPVRARAPSAWVNTARWVRRHPVATTAAAAGVIVAIGLPLALLAQESAHADELSDELAKTDAQRKLAVAAQSEADTQRNRARADAREAQTVSDFLVKLFADTDPARRGGRELSARDLLDLGVQRLETALLDEPKTRAALYLSIGDSYAGLGELEAAERILRRALQLSEEHLGDGREVAHALSSLSSVEREMGKPDALAHAERAVELLRKHTNGHSVDLADVLITYGLGLAERGRYDEAERAYEEALTNLDQSAPDLLSLRACVLVNYALLESDRGDHSEALRLGREALETQRESSLLPHPAITSALNIIGLSLCALGRSEEARPVFAELLELEPQVAGETLRLASFLMSSTKPDRDTGRFDDALPVLERADAMFARVVPATNDQALHCREVLIDVYMRFARWNEALELQGRVLSTLEDRDGPVNERVLRSRVISAHLHVLLGNLETAAEFAQTALDLASDLGEVGDTRWISLAAAVRAHAYLQRGEIDDARELVELAEENCAGAQSGTPSWMWTRFVRGELARADGAIEEALDAFAGVRETSHPASYAAHLPALATLHDAQLLAESRPERAAELAGEARDALVRTVGTDHPDTRAAQAFIDSL